MRKTLFLSFFISLSCIASAQPKAGHYTELDGKSGVNLVNAISTCAAKGYSSLGYNGLYTAYEQTDKTADGHVWDMYSNCVFSFSNKGGNSSECAGWNREHSVPQSWWGGGTSNQGCDIFHVVPTDCYVNNRRGSDPYGEVGSATYTSQNGSKSGTSSISGYSGKVFEPVDEYKGDLARGIMGSMLKWKQSWTQGQGNIVFNGQYDASHNFGFTAYAVSVFMKWHRLDPVSQKELDRNNAIEQTQGNRNPFIDYPELAEYVWGTKQGQTVSLASLVSAYSGQPLPSAPMLLQPAGNTSIDCGSVKPDSSATRFFSLKGINLTSAVSLSISGTGAGYFTVSPSSVTAGQANAGHNIAVIYSPDAEGQHTATLTVSSTDFTAVQITLTGKCAEQGQTIVIGTGDYVKVSEGATDMSGIYLIVNEENNVRLNGAASDLTGTNTMAVTITGGNITSSDAVNAAALTVTATTGGYFIQSSTGSYIGHTGSKNTLVISTSPDFVNTISINNGTANISCNNRSLLYNTSAHMFRFYTSGQAGIQLYRKTVPSEPTAVTNAEQPSYRLTTEDGVVSLTSEKPAQIIIYDRIGRMILMQEGITKLNANLPQGLYIVLVDNKSEKIIIR